MLDRVTNGPAVESGDVSLVQLDYVEGGLIPASTTTRANTGEGRLGRNTLGHLCEGQLLFEAFYSYLLPQFEGIDAPAGEQLFQALSPLMGTTARRNRLRDVLNSVLGLELQPPASAEAVADEADEEDVEQPEE